MHGVTERLIITTGNLGLILTQRRQPGFQDWTGLKTTGSCVADEVAQQDIFQTV
jgi:hypothetical protein